MKNRESGTSSSPSSASGFTLIELLIVIIILGILAMIIVPQITISTDDARLTTLNSQLATVRSAIELYYLQHANTYPWAIDEDTGAAVAAAADARDAFINQLTRYSDQGGLTVKVRDAAHPYGPYLKGTTLPTNPFNDANSIVCNIAQNDITVRVADGTDSGWLFYVLTGVFIANDGAAPGDHAGL